MSFTHPLSPLIAADLGNTQAKLGFYTPRTLAKFACSCPSVATNSLDSAKRLDSAGCIANSDSANLADSGSVEVIHSDSTNGPENGNHAHVDPIHSVHPEFLRTVRNDHDLETEIRAKFPEFFGNVGEVATEVPWNWAIASVNRSSTTRLVEWIRRHRPDDSIFLLAASDLPIPVDLPSPDRVGIDRLLDAVAANALRHPHHAAVVVDAGSAITVDLVSSRGVFCGGAILPGMHMSARAMHQFTDMLPLLETTEMLEHIPAVGRNTEHAMRSGLFWGTIGAIREIVYRMSEESVQREGISRQDVDLFLTGGTGSVAGTFLCDAERKVYYDAELTLLGIVLTTLPILQNQEKCQEQQ